MDWGLLALAVTAAVFVWVRVGRARRDEARQAEEREGYRQRIARDPKNAGAYEALGDSLRAAGQWQEAHQAYVSALDVSDAEAMTARVQYKVRQVDLDIRGHAARQSGRGRKNDAELFVCPRCGGANSPDRRDCETCGAALPHDTFGAALRDKEVLRASLEAAACVLVLLAALSVASTQPPEVKGVMLISTVIVVAWRLLRAIGSPRV